jgi:hypothetical protein
MTEIRATMRHLRALKFCSYGGRQFFARYGLDWSAFLREGIAVSDLEATGDALCLRLASYARTEAAE